jgi:hypothetical protein
LKVVAQRTPVLPQEEWQLRRTCAHLGRGESEEGKNNATAEIQMLQK